MLTLVLGETALERVPPELHGHQQVVTSARRAGARPAKMLLDSSLHHAAMRHHGLPDQERRGRPDIVHLFLLTGLESPLNHAGGLRLLVHTRNDELIRINPATRLVRNYQRFCGLIQQLFETGTVPPGGDLLNLQPQRTLESVVAELHADRLLVLDETAPPTHPWEVFAAPDADRHVVAVIGGFPQGRFARPVAGGDRVGLGPRALAVWTVAAELVVNYERWALPALEPTTA